MPENEHNSNATGLCSEMGVAVLNCGKCCGDTEGQDAVVELVASVLPDWVVIFLSEVDGVRRHLPPNDYSLHPSFRHWPGEGSFAMMFVIRKCHKHLVKSVKWRGRCGAVHLFQRDRVASNHMSVYILGVHAHHGDLQIDTFADVAWLLRQRPWGSRVLVAGDWNVDQLPSFAADPYAEKPGRETHHQGERVLVQTLADKFRLSLSLPEMVWSSPGGPFDDICSCVPISRIPTGECTGYHLPSLLDYGLGSHMFVKSCGLHWEGVPADHALITFSVDPSSILRKGIKTCWKCKDENQCLEWISRSAPDIFDDIHGFHSFIREMQSIWGDTQTCRERREQRLPDHLRNLYNLVANASTEHDRQRLRKEAWEIRREWCLQQKRLRLTEVVQKGRVFQKSKKLHRIEAFVLSSAAHPNKVEHVSYEEDEWRLEVADHFSRKWGVQRLQERMNILDAMRENDGNRIHIDPSELHAAFTNIKRMGKLDHYGTSVAAIKILAHARPELVCVFLETLISSTALMSEIVVKGSVFGKESSVTPSSAIRAILPLPSIMQILDVLLPSYIEDFVSRALPTIPECFVGARPGTQCLDIAHGLQTIIEKGLDNFGAAAVAQSDIEKYYDSLPVLRVVRWLIAHGVPSSLATCLTRHQMCPHVILKCGSVDVPIGARTVGGLTGSRIAGFLGRIPVEAIIADRHPHWRRHGFHANQVALCMCTWVDNLFSASASLQGAIYILEDFEAQLHLHWKMDIKPSSRCCMVAAGCKEVPANNGRWPLKDSFLVLGHMLQSTGSIRACWSRSRASMWRAFWANPGAEVAKHVSIDRKLQLLTRAVQPQLAFRCSRWPPQRQIAAEVDKLQQKMMASMLRLPRLEGEEPDRYVRRRGRLARGHCQQHGLWSAHWFARAIAWDEHLARPRNNHTWSARLRDFRGKVWLMQRRASFSPSGASIVGSASLLAGRTGTRAVHGKVQMRWHDGIDHAKSSS